MMTDTSKITMSRGDVKKSEWDNTRNWVYFEQYDKNDMYD